MPIFKRQWGGAAALAALLGLGAAPSSAATTANASYVVNLGGNIIANAKFRFVDDGSAYSLSLDANVSGVAQLVASGIARVDSSGAITDDGRPLPALGEDEADIRQRLYRTGDRELYRLRALLAAADGDRGDLDKRLGLADGWAWPKFPIGGLDLVELGVEPGPHLGDILNLVEDWWVRRDFAPDRDACLAAIRKSLAADA